MAAYTAATRMTIARAANSQNSKTKTRRACILVDNVHMADDLNVIVMTKTLIAATVSMPIPIMAKGATSWTNASTAAPRNAGSIAVQSPKIGS